jgi:transcriptional regulator with XRE-family HTH domain
MNIKVKSLGEFLKVHRLGEEKSQVEFADFLGISKQRLCDLEHNRSNVSVQLCKELADALDLPPEWLVKLALQHMLNKEGLDLKVS